jgi:Fe-S-cluster containining protein
LLVDINGGKGSLFLLPSETKLFPEELIRPLYGSGIKGRSRPRPADIWAYQINTNTCPYIQSDNSCAIYSKRPMICRAFPVEGIGIIILQRHCKVIYNTVKENEIIDKLEAPQEKEANAYLAHYTWQHVKGLVWYFDLTNEKWKNFPADKIRRRMSFG